MLTARLLAGMWLILVGLIWLIFTYIFIAVMTGISTFVFPVWISLIAAYAPPIVLVVACIFILMRRYTRTAVVFASLACAWLTWWGIRDLWPNKPENNAIAPMQCDWAYFTELGFVLSADVAIIVVWRSPQHLTNR